MDQQAPGGVVNITRALEALSTLLKNPRKTIIQVEALVTVAVVLLLLQLILGSYRRQASKSFIREGVSVIGKVMAVLVPFALGTMQSSPIKTALYPVWSVSLFIAAGGTNAIRQFRPVYNRNVFRAAGAVNAIRPTFTGVFGFEAFVQWCLQALRYTFYLVVFLMLINPASWKDFFVFNGLNERARDAEWPSASISCVGILFILVLVTQIPEGIIWMGIRYDDTGKVVADWMNKNSLGDHQLPERMEDYRYPVRYPARFDNFQGYGKLLALFTQAHVDVEVHTITVGHVWQCDRGILTSDSGTGEGLRDVCLSFSLFELLKRRFFGFGCAEANLDETHNFIFKQLLHTEVEYKRAFRIIEAELGFCHDFFFTKYQSIYRNEMVVFLVFLGRIILVSIVGLFVFNDSMSLNTLEAIIEVRTTRTDTIITLVVLGVILVVELLQAAFYLASDWFKVSLTCRYVRFNSCYQGNAFLDKFLGFICTFSIFRYWPNLIGQYSVISDSNRAPRNSRDTVKISDDVKRAIARSLVSSKGHLKNGNKSLKNNHQYNWVLEGETQIEAMLIWHLATDYCDIAISAEYSNVYEQDFESKRKVALEISRYCVYLMDSVPELLPYHTVDTEVSMQTLVDEVQRDGISKRHKYRKMKNLGETEEADQPTTMFKKGVKLGKQLMKHHESRVDELWTLLEDFWAETILYIAPSHSNAQQHMDCLEKGGEFLTHLWALLSHAGILKLDREKDQRPKRAHPSQQTV